MREAIETVEAELIPDAKSNLQVKLEELDASTEMYKECIAKGEALKRLQNSPDYKLIFTDGYMEKEPERVLGALINPTIYKRETLENLEDMLTGIRQLKAYIGFIESDAAIAPGAIDQNEEVRSQVTANPSLLDEEY